MCEIQCKYYNDFISRPQRNIYEPWSKLLISRLLALEKGSPMTPKSSLCDPLVRVRIATSCASHRAASFLHWQPCRRHRTWCRWHRSGRLRASDEVLRRPRGSRYRILKELGLKDHDYYGFWGPTSLIIWYLHPLGVPSCSTNQTLRGNTVEDLQAKHVSAIL